jgi:hypothetical protein
MQEKANSASIMAVRVIPIVKRLKTPSFEGIATGVPCETFMQPPV